MKWTVIIWIFYLLTLSVVPCSDAGNRCAESSPMSASTEPHDHQQDTDDNCTPFCHCTCCSISIAITDISIEPQLDKVRPPFKAQKTVLHDVALNSRSPGAIWQPPRMNA